MNSESNEKFMEEAFFQARHALKAQEVPVGCVFVHNSKIIASAGNTVNLTHNATRHAEINCIDQVVGYCRDSDLRSKQVFSEVSVYVTVEPCIMCMNSLLDLGVELVVFGCRNDRFGGQTVFDVASAKGGVGTKVIGGVRGQEAMDLLKEFYKGVNHSAPVGKVKGKKTD